MGFWSRIAEFARRKNVSSGDSPWMYGDWGLSNSGVAVNSFSSLQHVVVMACVSILSEDFAKLPIGVFRRLANGGKEPAKDHWFHQLLRCPNDWQTWFEFAEMMQSSLVLRGNSYAGIIRNGRGVPQSLVPIHPDHVAMWEAPGGEYFYLVTRQGLHEMAALSSLPIMVPSDDMLHIRGLASWNSLMAISRVQMMREAIGLSMAQEQLAARVAGSGARPSGVLQTEQKLSKEVTERLKADWQQSHGSVRNAGKTALLEQGLKWQQLSMTMVDAEFLASRRLSIEDIARGFRVPLYKLGVSDAGPGSSLVQMEQDYLNSVISSYCDRWVQKLEKTFHLGDDDLFVEFDYRRLIQADIATRLNANRIAIVGSMKTPNEVRRAEGDPDIEGGDILFRPANLVPIDTPVARGEDSHGGVGSDVTGVPAPGGDGDALRLPE